MPRCGISSVALCEERGKTILISSHILSEIALLADDIGIIDHGVLLEEESLAELEQKNGKSSVSPCPTHRWPPSCSSRKWACGMLRWRMNRI